VTPPLVIVYNASSVPVLQLAPSASRSRSSSTTSASTHPHAACDRAGRRHPAAWRPRQVQVDLDLHALQANNLTPVDVVTAVGAQSLILPAGTSKIGTREHDVDINGSARTIDELNDLPIKVVNGSPVYIRDVAHVRDGSPPQTNLVRVDGQRSALLIVQKNGNASTLQIVSQIKEMLPRALATLPPGLDVRPLADQSLFVRAAIDGVIREAGIAAGLTALMILLFLGSWRSTIIISISIPLSILASIITFSALGETINIMTLGGMALAVGILVDDATVAIENISTNLEQGKPLEQAILDGSQQIAVPAFVSTICICIVFVPLFFLTGVARYLFVPLGEAVVFAMLASYVLSRTLVPTLAKYLLRGHEHDVDGHSQSSRHLLARLQYRFEHGIQRTRDAYQRLLEVVVARRAVFVAVSLAFCLASLFLRSGWAKTSSPRWTAASSAFTSARRRARVSRRRPLSARKWIGSSASACRPGISARSSTTSAVRQAAST
jgi:multidrug efflux pump subunit AcrB